MALRDDGETLGLFEPLVLCESSKHYTPCAALAVKLREQTIELVNRVPEHTAFALARLIRIIECHHSNLIEGHDLSVHHIECGLSGIYSHDHAVQNMQREAQALYGTYQFIDHGAITSHPTDPKVLCELHRHFFVGQPQAYRSNCNPANGEVTHITPGALREQDVLIGRHVAISAGAVPRFLDRMHDAYKRLSPIDTILASASAHHRFSWVHPFIDGNGRVARMMSYALIKRVVGTNALWSLSRGLAQQSEHYKSHLAACDLKRRNGLDGRGTLSEEALAAFTSFFLQRSIDEVQLMLALMEPEALSNRIASWARGEIVAGNLPKGCDHLLKALLVTGSLKPSELNELSGLPRDAIELCLKQLVQIGAITNDHTTGELRIAFSAPLASIWLPELMTSREVSIAPSYPLMERPSCS